MVYSECPDWASHIQRRLAPARRQENGPNMTQNRLDNEAAASKRTAIGLSPRRTTAQEAVVRPPEQSAVARMQNWIILGLVAAMIVVTVALVIARMGGNATDAASVSDAISAIVQDSAGVLNADGTRTLSDDFTQEKGLLVRDFQPERWSMGTLPQEGLYRMRMWPGVISWSILGVANAERFRFSTSVAVSADTPWGYGGVMARHSDDSNLYMVQVDGAGRLRLIVQEEGVWSTLQDWTASPALRSAGSLNELTLQDDGETVSVYGNGTLLLNTDGISLPTGNTGVVAGSLQNDVAEANFDWVRFQTLP